MDPIILFVAAGIIILVVLKIFFSLAKLIFKLGVIILIVIIIWRALVMRG